MKKSTRNKVIIYGGNFAGGFFGVGNPVGALIYGALDILSNFSDKVRKSKYNRLAKAIGGGAYAIQSLSDMVGVFNGNTSRLFELPFDASMAYQLGIDTIENYKNRSFFGDVKGVVNDGKGLVGKFKK